MGVTLVIIAAIPAYIAAAIALFAGAAWLTAFAVLMGTGVGCALALAALRLARTAPATGAGAPA